MRRCPQKTASRKKFPSLAASRLGIAAQVVERVREKRTRYDEIASGQEVWSKFDPQGLADQDTTAQILSFTPLPVTVCIRCHGVDAGGFHGDVNDFRGIEAIPGSGPDAMLGYHVLEHASTNAVVLATPDYILGPTLKWGAQALKIERLLNFLKIVRPGPALDVSKQLVLHQDQIIMNNYRRYYSDAWLQTVRQFNVGEIPIHPNLPWQTVLGGRTDWIVRNRLRNYLLREAIPEGPGTDVLVNRWLRDPLGSGKYGIPDLRLMRTGKILEGTIGQKTLDMEQLQRFLKYSGGFDVQIVTPTISPGFSHLIESAEWGL